MTQSLNIDFDHTDLSANGGVPLCQIWERQAMKEVCDIAHYLAHGLFSNPADFADRLRQAAEQLEPEPLVPMPLLGLPTQRERAIAQIGRLKPEHQLTVFHLIDELFCSCDVEADQESLVRLEGGEGDGQP